MTKLEKISPTLIDTFDEATPFGCQRRGWFKYVLKNPEPQNESMAFGEALHAANENFLRAGAEPLVGDVQLSRLFHEGRPWLIKHLKHSGNLSKQAPWVLGVEAPMPEGWSFLGYQVSPRSKCDVVVGGGDVPAIIDWKTTSDIRKYAKTPGQLAKSTQMAMYADAFHRGALDAGGKVRLVHGYYQTKKTLRFEPVEVEIDKVSLDNLLQETIKPLLATIETVYRAPAAREVKPNRAACRLCPHKAICPADKENAIMGIFDKYKSNAAAVTPPDAPASNPAIAAKPVDTVPSDSAPVVDAVKGHRLNVVDVPAALPAPQAETAAEKKARLVREMAEAEAQEAREAAEAKRAAEEAAKALEPRRGRGRPPGAKNKVKDTEERADGVTFTKTTINFGVTMNLGNFNSVRIEAQHTVEYHDGDAQAAFETALRLAQEQVEATAKNFTAGPSVEEKRS